MDLQSIHLNLRLVVLAAMKAAVALGDADSTTCRSNLACIDAYLAIIRRELDTQNELPR